MGEISFCAYNTGVGWRNVVEKMHASANLAEWYRTRGRHPVYAKNQKLVLPPSKKGGVPGALDGRRLPIVD